MASPVSWGLREGRGGGSCRLRDFEESELTAPWAEREGFRIGQHEAVESEIPRRMRRLYAVHNLHLADNAAALQKVWGRKDHARGLPLVSQRDEKPFCLVILVQGHALAGVDEHRAANSGWP